MNQKELELKLALNGIEPRSYSLYGADYNECLVLSQLGNDIWQIYYFERGVKSGLTEYYREAEACEAFLQIILNDRLTRINMETPNYYLASTEGYNLEDPHKVFVLKQLRGMHRDDYHLVSIDPPIIGQKYGLGGKDITEVILASRLEGDTLSIINNYPMAVYVFLPLKDIIINSDELKDDDIELIAWAEIYQNEEGARKATQRQ